MALLTIPDRTVEPVEEVEDGQEYEDGLLVPGSMEERHLNPGLSCHATADEARVTASLPETPETCIPNPRTSTLEAPSRPTQYENRVQSLSNNMFHPSSSNMFHPSSNNVFHPSSNNVFHPSSNNVFHPSSNNMFHPSSNNMFRPSSNNMFHPSSSNESRAATLDSAEEVRSDLCPCYHVLTTGPLD